MASARARGEWALAAVWLAGVAGCGGSATPAGNGDHLIVDVDASTGEVLPMVDASSDSAIGAYVDVNSVPAVCSTCACNAATQFCFAGGGSAAAFSGTCDQTGGPLAVGCNLIPQACLNEPSCPCILSALKMGCHCSESDFSISCP